MAYDEGLAQRVRDAIAGEIGFVEKRMFGGVGVLLNGNMVCGVLNSDLIVRVGLDRHDEAIARPGARLFDITGRAMKGWAMVGDEALDDDDAFEWWLKAGIAHARSLPAKDPAQKRAMSGKARKKKAAAKCTKAGMTKAKAKPATKKKTAAKSTKKAVRTPSPTPASKNTKATKSATKNTKAETATSDRKNSTKAPARSKPKSAPTKARAPKRAR